MCEYLCRPVQYERKNVFIDAQNSAEEREWAQYANFYDFTRSLSFFMTYSRPVTHWQSQEFYFCVREFVCIVSSEELHIFGNCNSAHLVLFAAYASLCNLHSKETTGIER